MKAWTTFLAFLISTNLTACAFKNTDTINSQEAEDNFKLEQSYKNVIGEYQGQIISSVGTQTVSLQIYTLSVKNGTNADGTNKFLTVPKAYLKKISPIGAGQLMDIRYIPESAQVVLTASEDKNLGIDDYHTINAALTNNSIVGEVLKTTGPFGKIALNLISREASTPDSGSAKEEYANNLTKEYEKIIGDYEGLISESKVDNGMTYPIKLRLFMVKEVVNGAVLPVLKGFYKRGDDDSAIFDLSMNVAYDPSSTPAVISLSGKGEGKYFISMDGYVRDTKLIVNFTTHRGLVGQVILTKKN